MKRILASPIVLDRGMAAMASCTKDSLDDMSYEDLRVHITQKNDSVGFSTYYIQSPRI
ncbi:MAG: hypothetical protein QM610_01755 [Chitinophagaceae bacterium]